MRLAVSLLLLAALTLAACDSADEDVARADSTVTVAYEGRLDNGTVFDESDGATFSLRRVIPGFRDGIVGMRIGESKTFTIPPPGSGIPPNAALTFAVTLLDVL